MTHADRFWSRVERRGRDECWPWRGRIGPHGYGRYRLHWRESEGQAHRIALALYLGRPLQGWACHHCDNRACVNPAHLYEGDRDTNTRDAVARRRFRPKLGESNPLAKLTAVAVAQLRSEHHAGGVSYGELGRRFGISHQVARRIVLRQTWAHV